MHRIRRRNPFGRREISAANYAAFEMTSFLKWVLERWLDAGSSRLARARRRARRASSLFSFLRSHPPMSM